MGDTSSSSWTKALSAMLTLPMTVTSALTPTPPVHSQTSNGAAQQAAPRARPPVEQAETPRDVVFVSSEVTETDGWHCIVNLNVDHSDDSHKSSDVGVNPRQFSLRSRVVDSSVDVPQIPCRHRSRRGAKREAWATLSAACPWRWRGEGTGSWSSHPGAPIQPAPDSCRWGCI